MFSCVMRGLRRKSRCVRHSQSAGTSRCAGRRLWKAFLTSHFVPGRIWDAIRDSAIYGWCRLCDSKAVFFGLGDKNLRQKTISFFLRNGQLPIGMAFAEMVVHVILPMDSAAQHTLNRGVRRWLGHTAGLGSRQFELVCIGT
jgi:hypothetical protein